jgi:hypothetical protein
MSALAVVMHMKAKCGPMCRRIIAIPLPDELISPRSRVTNNSETVSSNSESYTVMVYPWVCETYWLLNYAILIYEIGF